MKYSELKVLALIESTGLFDPDFYLRMYPDVWRARMDPLIHYLHFGHREDRNPSTHFDTRYYREHHMPDADYGCPLIHFALLENPEDMALRPPNATEIESLAGAWDHSVKAALQLHLYYPNVVHELTPRIVAIPSQIDLLISTTSQANSREIEQALQSAGVKNDYEVKVVENVGRDMAPLFVGFAEAWTRYDLICHLHSKTSPHTEFGERWRSNLFDQLIGSEAHVKGIVALFQRDESLGALYPENYFEIKRHMGWGGNEKTISDFLSKIGFGTFDIDEAQPEFAAGSMCWMRTASYDPLNQGVVSNSDFEPEMQQQERTFAHVLERCLALIPQLNGFETRKFYNGVQDLDSYRRGWLTRDSSSIFSSSDQSDSETPERTVSNVRNHLTQEKVFLKADPNQKRILLIAGMHRSGTSMLARLLNLHGVYLPLEMEYKDEFNEKGYWESFEIQQLNSELLRLGDSSWFDLRAFSADRQPAEKMDSLREKFRGFVTRVTDQSGGIVAIKDPRICRVIPFWLEVLEQCTIQPMAVFPYRNPLEVASSIKYRDGFSTRYCLNLWLRNVLEAEVATRGMDRVFCSYTEMLNDWPGLLSIIETDLQLSELLPYSDVEDQVSGFISGSLKHWGSSDADLKAYVGSDGLAFRALQLLRKSEFRDGPEVHSEFDALREELNQKSTIPEELERRDQKVIAFQRQLSDAFDSKQEELNEIHIKLEQSSQRLAESETYRTHLTAELSENQKSLEQKESHIAHLVSSVSGLEELLNRNSTEAARVSGELTDLQTQYKDLEFSLIDVKKQKKKLKKNIASLAEDRESKNAALAQFEVSESRLRNELDQRAREFSEQKAALVDEIEQKNQQIESLNLHLEAHSSELKRLQRELADHVESIEKIGKTLSWKVTAPLRFVVDWMVLYPLHLLKKGSGTLFKLRSPANPGEPVNFATELINSEVSERSYVEKAVGSPSTHLPLRLIAFYLPQFHPIPENDEWWGKGFTEWKNVRKAKPLFPRHHQPRVPGDLGYYDLRDIEVQKKQVELAKQYGLGGFCFYFYWFRGDRLLETPVLQYLENQDLDLPFCLCWANENWTRTWDGKDGQVLIGQEHSEQDDLAFIEYLSKYLTDSRYIRVEGKPLVLVYRPSLLPNPAQTAHRWRKWCIDNGIGEIYLAYTQSFEKIDPAEIGFDAAIEFPPNNTGPEIITDQVKGLSFGFKGFVYDWTSVASRSESYLSPDYTLFRGVTPCWDNTARRQNTGAVFAGNTPSRYQSWLENAIFDTQVRFEDPSKQLVFINAWNEWAEGAYLEPDAAYGYAYLQATRNALENTAPVQAWSEMKDRKMILVAHDGHPHGAQYLMLYTAKCLNEYFGFEVDLVVLGEGILIEEFKKWATVHNMAGFDPLGDEAKTLADSLAKSGHTAAICNTTVSGLFLQTLSSAGLKCISLVHELSNVIVDNHLEPNARSIAEYADKVVFAATQVKEPFLEIADVPEERVVIRFQGNYKKNAYLGKKEKAQKRLRRKLKLPSSAKIVLGAGYLDHRKGVDLFVKAGLALCASMPDAYFVWIGHWEINMEKQIDSMLKGEKHADRFIFPGRQDDTDLFFAGADIFALTSREDPFPTTVMEALEVSTPVVGFKGAGGSENLIKQGCGLVVPIEDIGALAAAFGELLGDRELVKTLGDTGAQIVNREFSFPHYVFDLLELAGKPLPRVSAIVPNYNYERHLEQRLHSIFDQSFPIYELIVLDDASTDGSVELIEKLLAESDIQSTLVLNETNSGSVFRQWTKGVNQARGDLVWICEADDFAAPEFLAECVGKMSDEGVVLSYAQSGQVDEAGNVIEKDYLKYTSDVCSEKWRSDYVADGMDELKCALSIKNTVPNVSGVIFRKRPLEQCLADNIRLLEKLKIAGDWLVYCELLKKGKIAFSAKPLNFHRRHDESVTISKNNNLLHMSEIIFMQEWVTGHIELDAEAVEKAGKFVDHAYRYLELDGELFPTPIAHPEISENLERLKASAELVP